jgi:hypothetical protein
MCWNTKWHLQWPITYHFLTKSKFHTVYKYKKLNTVTIFNSIYISTEGSFFMCEGYTELAPSVAILCSNMAVEKKSRMPWLSTSSCLRLAVSALSFFELNFVLYCVCFEHVRSWLYELSELFLSHVASLLLKTWTKHYGLQTQHKLLHIKRTTRAACFGYRG